MAKNMEDKNIDNLNESKSVEKVKTDASDSKSGSNGDSFSEKFPNYSGSYDEEKIKKDKKNGKLSLGRMFEEIESYGFHYSFKSFLGQLLIVWAILGAAAYFYSLQLWCYIVIYIVASICTPIMIKAQYKYKYENQKFNDVGDYLQQMTTSFLKTKKIRESLAETSLILSGRRIVPYIDKAIKHIDTAHSNTIYEEAFAIIEEEYGCEKMKSLHNFLVKIEAEGGDFEDTLNLMINDSQSWVEMTYKYQEKRSGVQKAMMISIVLAIIMCGILNQFIPSNMQFYVDQDTVSKVSLSISDYFAYQLISSIFLSLMMVVYTFSHSLMQGSWLVDKGVRKDKDIVRDYRFYRDYDYKEQLIKYLLWAVPIAILGIILFLGILPLPVSRTVTNVMGVMFIMTALYYLTMPKRKLKNTKKRLTRDIQKAFPDWVRDVSISLNTQTVQNAIIQSEEKTPTVMRPAVHKLIEDFTTDPTSYKPWASFLDDFDVPELKTAARMFYSINELSGETAKEQINVLIGRNTRSVQEADKAKAEDEISSLGFTIAIPMGISILKLITDMGLLFMKFVSLTSVISSVMGGKSF